MLEFTVENSVTLSGLFHLQCIVRRAFPNFYMTIVGEKYLGKTEAKAGKRNLNTFGLTVREGVWIDRSYEVNTTFKCVVFWPKGSSNETIEMSRTIQLLCKSTPNYLF